MVFLKLEMSLLLSIMFQNRLQTIFLIHGGGHLGRTNFYHCIIQILKVYHFLTALAFFCLWGNLDLYQLRRRLLRDVESNKLHTWDVQLQWSIFLAKKKVLTPPVNLVKNVGNDSLASTFVAGKSDFEQDYFNLPEATLQLETSHLPSYDIELCRSKSNLVYIKNKLRNIKGKLFF